MLKTKTHVTNCTENNVQDGQLKGMFCNLNQLKMKVNETNPW